MGYNIHIHDTRGWRGFYLLLARPSCDGGASKPRSAYFGVHAGGAAALPRDEMFFCLGCVMSRRVVTMGPNALLPMGQDRCKTGLG